jgi:hypothetical protein
MRALHAFKQLDTQASLWDTVMQQGSMVVWGPISSPLSSVSVIIFFQPSCCGTFFVEVSDKSEFDTLKESKQIEVVGDAVEGGGSVQPTSMQVVVDNLSPSTKYFVRVYKDGVNGVDEDKESRKKSESHSVDDGDVPVTESKYGDENHQEVTAAPNTRAKVHFYSQRCSFWTLPSEEDQEGGAQPVVEPADAGVEILHEHDGAPARCAPVALHCVHAELSPKLLLASAYNASTPGIVCMVGDPVAAPDHATQIEQEGYMVDTWALHTQNASLSNHSSLLRSAAVVLSWNDSRFGSDMDIRAEEVAFKRHNHDLKKYTKKYGKGGKKANSKALPPPVLQRPESSCSLSSLVSAFPVTYSDGDSARSVYKSIMIGPDVQLLLLDIRSGYISKEQAKWIKDTITTSDALWKIVVSGLPLGIEPKSEEKDEDAAARPGSRHRSRISSGTLSLVDDEGNNAKVQSVDSKKDVENDDCDEFGRSRTSLPYLVSSIHRSLERKKNATDVDDGVDDESNSKAADTVIDEQGDNSSTISAEAVVDATKLDDTVTVQSGIVFVTSNPSANYGQVPFTAVYDPADTGVSFCAEINFGGNCDGTEAVPQPPYAKTPHLNSTFLREVALPKGQYQCDLRLNANGSLTVEMFCAGKVSPRKHFTQTFKK